MKTPEGPGKPGLRAKVTKARANSNDSRDTIRAAGDPAAKVPAARSIHRRGRRERREKQN
jgi:hypothetical protein